MQLSLVSILAKMGLFMQNNVQGNVLSPKTAVLPRINRDARLLSKYRLIPP